MLWLALRFSLLPLDALAPPPDAPSTPRAAASQGRVVAANGAARQLGVAPGMGLASAWGLAPELKVTERDGAAETRALAGLACWGGNFTPQVSLDPPAGLLLVAAANWHLVYVAVISQPDCVAHLRAGSAQSSGQFSAAKSSCTPS